MSHTLQPLALRPRQAARLLGVCERTLANWTRQGSVPYIKLGRAVLYPVDLLQDWLRQKAARQQGQGAEQVEGQGNAG